MEIKLMQNGLGPQYGTFEQAQPVAHTTSRSYYGRALLKCGGSEAALVDTTCHAHWADNILADGISYSVDNSGDWTLTKFKSDGTQEVRDIRARLCNMMQQNSPL